MATAPNTEDLKARPNMNAFSPKYLLIGLIMIIAAGLAVAMKPTHKLADPKKEIDLETIIPKQFGGWVMTDTFSSGIINPPLNAVLREIYSQTLSRTYVNENSEKIMLSIAYGDNQSHKLQVHRPEVCYSSQGFTISGIRKFSLNAYIADIPAMRLLAYQGQRYEPITYWVRIGGKVVRGNLEQGFARLLYGLRGYIVDGLVFRISSLDTDVEHAYSIHDKFIKDLLSAIPSNLLSTVIGGYRDE
jgi:EpsI family protein